MSTSKALMFAWLIEIVAVAMGLGLATFAGIEGSDAGVVGISIAILPFAALSIIELTKIPLVGLAFQVQNLAWRVIASVAILLVTAATFENFVFAFERGFNERIRSVEAAEQAVQARENELQIANARIPQLTARQTELTERLATLREEAAAIRQQAKSDIDDVRSSSTAASFTTERARLEQDLAGLDQRREAALANERARCRNPDTRCNLSALAGSFQRQREDLNRQITRRTEQQHGQETAATDNVVTARNRRDDDLAGRDRERKTLNTDLESVREMLASAQATSVQGSGAVAQAATRRDEIIERSQLHRLAMVLFGSREQHDIEKTKQWFVLSLALIVSVVGSLIAAMHYEAQNERGRRRGLVGRAIRGYVARHRRAVPVRRRSYLPEERHGAVRNLRGWLARRRRGALPVRVKEVVREVPVDRLKIIFLPLDATEEQVAHARREAQQEAA